MKEKAQENMALYNGESFHRGIPFDLRTEGWAGTKEVKVRGRQGSGRWAIRSSPIGGTSMYNPLQ